MNTIAFGAVQRSGFKVQSCEKIPNEAMRSAREFKVPGSTFKVPERGPVLQSYGKLRNEANS
jgi:hypothetical protein